MKLIGFTAAALVLAAGSAHSAGVERTTQSVAPIFKPGTYVEFTFGSVSPSTSGVGLGPASALRPTPGVRSGDMTDRYNTFGTAMSHQYNDRLSVALIFDQPWGADVNYPTGTGYYAQGSTAELRSNAITGIVKYTTPQNVSVYGGLRYQSLRAEAVVPFVSPVPGVTPPYSVDGEINYSTGYLVGAAWERPEIAARVSLTYISAIEHNLDTSESSVLGTSPSQTRIETPQSLNLEFQTGIAPDTLLFGSVRWVDWTEFEIAPAQYGLLTGGNPLVYYEEDYVAYTLGLGRRFTENWSGAVSVGYEPQSGELTGNLGPTDGSWSVGLGATYTNENVEITGGVRYIAIGDANPQLRRTAGAPAADFSDNEAVAFGLKVGFTF